jgi:thioredoxin 1
MTKLIIFVLIGGAIGAFIGYKGKCTTGACPLTSNPYIGGIYGAIMAGLLFSVTGGTQITSAYTGPTSVIRVESETQFNDIITNSNVPVVAKFGAEWCPPCKKLEPVLAGLSVKEDLKARIIDIDVDENPELANKYIGGSIPSMVLFKNGRKVKTIIGYRSEEEIRTKFGI